MVSKLQILTLVSFVMFSCSKDELQEDIALETNIFLPEEVESKPLQKPEEITYSSFDKTKNWITNAQMANGLLESSENTNFVSLYDNALAALVFIRQGQFEKAEHIIDFFESKMQLELSAGTGGFYQFRDQNGENGSRTWMGDNAWLLIAINHYHEAYGNQKYAQLASGLENWLRQLQDNDGGLHGGFNEDGSVIPKVSEGIITAFNAVPGYDDFHKNILSYLSKNRWSANETTIVAWPENSAYNYALDLHALSYGAFKEFHKKTLSETERYVNTQIATVSGIEVSGYCFDEDKDVIWLEGTAQMAVAYHQSGNTAKAEQLITEIEKTIITSTASEHSSGIPYTTNHGTTFGTNTLWDHADIAPALSSSAWYLFAKMGFSPLALGKQKNIPEADQFWISQP